MKFHPGSVVATPGVEQAIGLDAVPALLHRHLSGDWGEVDDHDRAVNDQALLLGNRLLSAYEVPGSDGASVRVWVMTEADRSTTTVLLPGEY